MASRSIAALRIRNGTSQSPFRLALGDNLYPPGSQPSGSRRRHEESPLGKVGLRQEPKEGFRNKWHRGGLKSGYAALIRPTDVPVIFDQ